MKISIQCKSMRSRWLMLLFLLVLSSGILHAQTILVKGKITDETGAAMPGATVKIKGKAGATSTDGDGNFAIQAAATDVLTINIVGYTTEEVTINNRTTINVQLKPGTNDLTEVVVVGYGTQLK